MLGAAMLARTSSIINDKSMANVAKEAMEYGLIDKVIERSSK